jgi:hypothetical protein
MYFFLINFRYKYEICSPPYKHPYFSFLLFHIDRKFFEILSSYKIFDAQDQCWLADRTRSCHLQTSGAHLSTYLWLLERHCLLETKTHIYAVFIQFTIIPTYPTFLGMSYKPHTSEVLRRFLLFDRQSSFGFSEGRCRNSRCTVQICYLTP